MQARAAWTVSAGQALAAGAGDQPTSPTSVVPQATRSDQGNGRILVVEDEWLIASQVEWTLSSAGFEIVGIATSAVEAVSMAAETKPDLILMDIRLRGDGDGVDAALEIRRQSDVPILFASAHADGHTRERAAPVDARAWVTKPYTDRDLVRAVTDVLAARSA